MADPAIQNIQGSKMSSGQSLPQDEGIMMSPPSEHAGQINGIHFNKNGGEPGFENPSPHSPPDVTDSKYEFDQATPDLVSPLKSQSSNSSVGGALVDFDATPRDIHETSTAEVTPQSPPYDVIGQFQKEADTSMPPGGKTESERLAELGIFEGAEPDQQVPGSLANQKLLEELGVFQAPPPPPLDETSDQSLNQPDLISGGPANQDLAGLDVFGAPPPEQPGASIPPPANSQANPQRLFEGLDPLNVPPANFKNDVTLVDLDSAPEAPPANDNKASLPAGTGVDLLADQPLVNPLEATPTPPSHNGFMTSPPANMASAPLEPKPAPANQASPVPPLDISSLDNSGDPSPKPSPTKSPQTKLFKRVHSPQKKTPPVSSPQSKTPSPPSIPSPTKPASARPEKEAEKTVEEEERPQTAPSKIPSPKKERTNTAATTRKAVDAYKKDSPRSAPPKKNTASPRPNSAKKDAASDSGIEDDKANGLRRPQSSTTTKTTPKPLAPRNAKTTPKTGGLSPRTPTNKSSPAESPRGNGYTPRSKVGSVANIKHKPGGGDVKIETNAKVDTSSVGSKCQSKANIRHVPGGGDKKIESHKVEWNTQSKIGSMKNLKHKPQGGDVKIESKKLEWKAESKVGSMKNTTHVPGGGDKRIESQKLEWNAGSKIGSKKNLRHTPGGGDKKIESQKLEWKVESRVGSLDNARHRPGGGDKKIETQKLDWKVDSKVGSLKNATHVAGGGDKAIETHKVDFKDKAQSKVGSMKNLKHQAGGGDVMIENHRLDFKERASPRTDTGFISSPVISRSPRVSENSSLTSEDPNLASTIEG